MVFEVDDSRYSAGSPRSLVWMNKMRGNSDLKVDPPSRRVAHEGTQRIVELLLIVYREGPDEAVRERCGRLTMCALVDRPALARFNAEMALRS